jgi:hypothetical protein
MKDYYTQFEIAQEYNKDSIEKLFYFPSTSISKIKLKSKNIIFQSMSDQQLMINYLLKILK